MRIFLDANVLFSASNFGSNVARLVDIACQAHSVLTCDLALEEARRNILIKRPQWQDEFGILEAKIFCVPTVLFELPIELAEKDRPILCSAISSNCDLLATGDKRDFGHLFEQTIQATVVVSLTGLANRLITSSSEGA